MESMIATADLPTTVRINIRRFMLVKGIGPSDLAAQVGVSRQAIHNFLTGKNQLTLTRVGQIAQALGVRYRDLVK